ncbi:MAG TPA: hypothetical protein VHY22_00200 [Chthoniobacteraceae bacterium]|nr:hypothetical protein [Chthoniobacteraceae bacterium]
MAERDVSSGLAVFLKNILQRRKWVRKINIPRDHDDAAAALVCTTTLKEGGLEILSELYVYCAGKTIVEKWEVAGEREQIRLLPKESFQAIDITEVRMNGLEMTVEFTTPAASGHNRTHRSIFDFAPESPRERTVLHPLLQQG